MLLRRIALLRSRLGESCEEVRWRGIFSLLRTNLSIFSYSKDIETGTESELGRHAAPVSCMVYSCKTGNLFTGGWDSSVCMWDTRSSTCALKQEEPGKVYSIDIVGYRLVVATSGRRMCINDIRNMKTPVESKESPLKYMTRKVKCMPNGEG